MVLLSLPPPFQSVCSLYNEDEDIFLTTGYFFVTSCFAFLPIYYGSCTCTAMALAMASLNLSGTMVSQPSSAAHQQPTVPQMWSFCCI